METQCTHLKVSVMQMDLSCMAQERGNIDAPTVGTFFFFFFFLSAPKAGSLKVVCTYIKKIM